TMLHYERLAPLEPDEERIRREFREGEPTYGHLFDLFHRHRAERLGRHRWGDKSLHTEHYADLVFAEFPQARMIHVMRDPRDRHASVMRRYPDVTRHVGPVTGRWVASERSLRRNLRRHPGRYLAVRYEDLVRHPVDVLGEVCRFVEEPYTDEMLAMKGDPDHQEGNSSFESFAPGVISTRAIGRYAGTLERRDIAFIETVARRPMARLEYLPPPGERTRPRARDIPYLVENLARMRVWMALDEERPRRGGGVPAERLGPEKVR
ncbi:MAG: sulfotransferase family protein, partial [Actinomycetota bacterium]